MAYLETKLEQARALAGKRVEIPVHYDAWMRGARFGVVTSIGPGGDFVRVKLDNPQVKARLKVWRLDFDFIKLV